MIMIDIDTQIKTINTILSAEI